MGVDEAIGVGDDLQEDVQLVQDGGQTLIILVILDNLESGWWFMVPIPPRAPSSVWGQPPGTHSWLQDLVGPLGTSAMS